MSLPNDQELRAKIQDALQRGLSLLNEKDAIDSDIEGICITLSDTKVISSKDFKKLLVAKYEGNKLLEKAQQKVV